MSEHNSPVVPESQSSPAPDLAVALLPASEEPAVDFERINAALNLNIAELASKQGQTSPAPTDMESTVRELADDMLELFRRMQTIEESLQRIPAQLSRVDGAVQSHARELGNLRQDICVELRVNSVAAVLRAVGPLLTTIVAARAGLHSKKDERFIKQIDALKVELDSALNTLGCVPFIPKVGDPFNPATMEVSGYAKGQRSVVLAVDRPGYYVANRVIRTAGVRIADPTKTPHV